MEEKTNSGRFFVGKPKRNKPPGRPRRRWQNLKWILKNRMQGCGLDSSSTKRNQWRVLVNRVVNIRIAENEGKCLTSSENASFTEEILSPAVSYASVIQIIISWR